MPEPATHAKIRQRIQALERRLSIWGTACAIVCLSLLAIIAVAVAMILPMRASWEYGRKTRVLEIDGVESPTLITVRISYEGSAPKDIRLIDPYGESVKGAKIEYGEKEISVTAEVVSSDGKPYRIELIPGTDSKLSYAVKKDPSYKSMRVSAEIAEGLWEGSKILRVSRGYPYKIDDSELTVTASSSMQGEGRITVYDERMEGDSIELDIGGLFDKAGASAESYDTLSVTVRISYDSPISGDGRIYETITIPIGEENIGTQDNGGA